jgi:hypothetical protein
MAGALALSACRHAPAPEPRSPSPEPSRCDPALQTPAGFEVTGSMEDPSGDHTGVRVDLRADGGRELHYFAGIAGEFGEGLPDRGTVTLADGSTARLVGRGTTWVLAWEGQEPCSPRIALGTGMDAEGFRVAMRQAGALPARA